MNDFINHMFILAFLAAGSQASAETTTIGYSLYRGNIRESKATCTIEIRGFQRRSAAQGGDILSIVTQPRGESIDIAPMKTGDVGEVPRAINPYHYAGFRGEGKKIYMIEMKLNGNLIPEAFRFYDSRDNRQIEYICENLIRIDEI